MQLMGNARTPLAENSWSHLEATRQTSLGTLWIFPLNAREIYYLDPQITAKTEPSLSQLDTKVQVHKLHRWNRIYTELIMKNRSALPWIAVGLTFLLLADCKKADPYKVLGVDRSASQREIQKAFHKLSLQYHPDKNKNKGAQEKFAEINNGMATSSFVTLNTYDILSDEQKRKNYDLYGDEKGTPGFEAGDPGNEGGYRSYFTSGGPGQSGFSFRPGDWQNMGGGQDGSRSFSFSFGGPASGKQSSFGFGFDDIFSNFFSGGGGGDAGGKFSGSHRSSRSQYGNRHSSKSIPSVNSQIYRKEIVDGGMTWLLLVYTPNLQGIQYYESVAEEVATSLQGALKVGTLNCESEKSLCKELGVYPRREPRFYIYSFGSSGKGSLVEYDGDLEVKSLKSISQEHLPRISKRVNLNNLNVASGGGSLPKVLLLSTKKNTPVIWRALSGLYRKRFIFYDAEVRDVSDSSVRELGIDSLPAIVGWLSNGEKQVIKSGISVKDMNSAIQDLSKLLDNFEKKNKKAASKKDQTESGERNIPLLTASNFNEICDEKVPVCLIGVFRSSITKDKLQKILQSVSQKSFSRRLSSNSGPRDSVAYALLDASKHQSFLNTFDKSGFKSSDMLLLAYKPKRGTYATSRDKITEETAERFISSVLNGDVQFSKTRQKPNLK
ncbi:chaperone protein dnaJ [Striga asiatica]|uniref:Chaperone protein dnaJ n=1 Tax=Striga asiatica TaxID=4170 RepID=A0A5A7REB7_STRAF|nr:chaperone protein dnaJ [Striga asiatica]